MEKDCSIVLAHPKYVKAIRGKKTDKKDAKWIADLFKHDLVAGSFMPPADIRQLRDLMRFRYKLTCFRSSEKNRLQNCLTVSNIQLGSVGLFAMPLRIVPIANYLFQPYHSSLKTLFCSMSVKL